MRIFSRYPTRARTASPKKKKKREEHITLQTDPAVRRTRVLNVTRHDPSSVLHNVALEGDRAHLVYAVERARRFLRGGSTCGSGSANCVGLSGGSGLRGFSQKTCAST